MAPGIERRHRNCHWSLALCLISRGYDKFQQLEILRAVENPKVRNHSLLDFAVQRGSFRMGHLSNCSQLSISQDHYIRLNLCTEQTQISQDSSSVTPLPNPPGGAFFSRSDQLLLDLLECFWICSPGIGTVAFNVIVQVQVLTVE